MLPCILGLAFFMLQQLTCCPDPIQCWGQPASGGTEASASFHTPEMQVPMELSKQDGREYCRSPTDSFPLVQQQLSYAAVLP